MTGRVDRDRAARAALSAAVEPPGADVARYLIAHGPAATEATLRGATQHKLDRTGRIHRRLTGVDGADLLASAADISARFVCPGDPEWPPAFDDLAAAVDIAGDDWVPPPTGVWVRGVAELAEATARSAGVVGARAATGYGTHVAGEIGAALTTSGWTVVSGAAYGIDAFAHRGALAVGGATIAVLACGVDVTYPRSHHSLLSRIAETGLIVSELPPGTTPNRPRFLARNRLIAAVTTGTVVIEAAPRSGALSTAGWALKLSRPLGAVPGPVTATTSGGCHKLIREYGATLVTTADEIIDLLGDFGADAAPAVRGEERELDRVTGAAAIVYEALPARAVTTVDRLCAETGLAVPDCVAALGELAAYELVRRADSGWQRVPPARRAGAPGP